MNERARTDRRRWSRRSGRLSLGILLACALSLSSVPPGAQAEMPGTGTAETDPSPAAPPAEAPAPQEDEPEVEETSPENPEPSPESEPVPGEVSEPEQGAQSGEEEFGANGGVVSNSPGPADARDGTPPAPRALAAAGRALIGDNYPAKYKNLPMYPIRWDEWNFAHRQCTSFVAWRLNSANKVAFSNQYKGLWAWGNAAEWAASARSVGIKVDTTPEVGAVAWSGAYYGGASEYGHVAWVADVLDDGRVVIEEYNFGWAGTYHTRTVRSDAFQGYIHIADLQSSFTKTPKPTVTGVPMVNGTLTAKASGWTPTPDSISYQWMRNGLPILGATRAEYSPVAADLGTSLSVETTARRAKYRTTKTVSAGLSAVLMTDLNGNGIDDGQEIAPWNTDVNGDGLPDAVGFGGQGVAVALRSATGLGAAKLWCQCFGTNTGWLPSKHPRAFVDLNGDGKADVAGFASDGVYVALSTGTSFAAMKRWSAEFGSNAGWNAAHHPRTFGDVNGDGKPDVLAFASDGVYVSLNTGSSFAKMSKWYDGYNAAKGWSAEQTPRFFADVNGDGKTDIVGISQAGVYVALSSGRGFLVTRQWTTDFRGSAGWKMNATPRLLADVTGDGLPDLVGFANDGVYVARNTGSGLAPATRWVVGFGGANGWRTGQHPRVLADVDGDGRADVVGFGAAGVSVALSTGGSFGTPSLWSKEFGSSSWHAGTRPRMVSDANGDGYADIVGFDLAGVRVSLSDGRSFRASKIDLAEMGQDAGGWRVASHPRGIGIQSLSQRPIPIISGEARVGKRLSATAGSWQPAPVKLARQWLRDGKPIAGATEENYTLVPQDLGTQISHRVEGSKVGHAEVSRTSGTKQVSPGRLVPGTPQVSGVGKEGKTLTVDPGTWGPGKVTLRYQWNRGGVPVAGATGRAYAVTRNDIGRRISVTVSGRQEGYSHMAQRSDAVSIAGVPTLPMATPFADVNAGQKFSREISWMHATGLSTGVKQRTGKPRYEPGRHVTRETMAAFIYRLDVPPSSDATSGAPFIDVPAGQRFSREIAWMYSSGLSTGTRTSAGMSYSPGQVVSRATLAAFLFRFAAPDGYVAPRASPFADVPVSHRFYREIAWMHDVGLSTGIPQPSSRPRYEPSAPVTRGALAAFLYRLETGDKAYRR